jgi:hypothetical protein
MVRLSGIVRDLLLKFRGRQRQQAETSGQGTKIKIQVCPLCKQIKKHDRWEALTIYDEVHLFKNRGNWKVENLYCSSCLARIAQNSLREDCR